MAKKEMTKEENGAEGKFFSAKELAAAKRKRKKLLKSLLESI